MFPLICHIGPFPVYSYGLMLALAVLASSYLLARDAAVIGIKPDVIYDLVFWVVVSGILGARLFYVSFNWDVYAASPVEIVKLWQGGLAWQGSFAGGMLGAVVFIRRQRLPLWPLLDAAAPYIALGQAIGRIGCLLNGCCYGKAADWGLYFPVWGERLIPTQLFMSLGQLVIFAILRYLGLRRQMRVGQIFILYLLLSSVERFTIEFFRADHVLYGPFSIFQYVCLALFVAALVLLMRRERHT
ncbi:MAG: prolipoprotein diacylglyceryl transferase [Candidatus Omnitrophica bacterium]|nr:prolipoprotein diacylglyceryl transferase [Candidatus Omnitrophota bacterium]